MTWTRPTKGLIRGFSETPVLIERGGTGGLQRSATQRAPLFLPSLPPSYRVVIGQEALRSIQREVRAMFLDCLRSDNEMHETGGWLLGHRHRPDHIVAATEPGADARYSRSSMRLGSERLEEIERAYPHLCVSGSYHVHPGDDDGTPSEADRQAWERWRELDGVGYHAGVIVTRGKTAGWTDPRLSGWLSTESFCERLKLEL